jgi:acetylornithine/N-succinyldiaminopimelate aminotransferase
MTVSDDWISRAEKVIMKNVGRYPLVPVRGEGCVVWDADGKRYLDFLAGVAVNSLGHCHPKVVKALQDQAATLIHCSNYYHNAPQTVLAELLCANSFADQIFFCNSGAEANEAAIKLARKYSRDTFGPERFAIITATDSFHGRTMATVSATGQATVQKFFDPLLHGFTHIPFNDIAALEAAIIPQTCAIMLEPVQGEGGVNIPAPGYFQEVRRLCDRHGLLLILDEVQTGMGRTGKMFAYEHFDVTPDIMSLAKALGGGGPIGAMLARDGIAAAFTPGTHGSTFGGNPLMTATAVAALNAILDEDLPARAVEMGAYLVGELHKLKEHYPFIKAVRGIGLMVGLVLSIPGADIVKEGHARGLLLNVIHDTVLRFVPPLIVTKAEIDEAVSILDGILAEI